MHCWSNKTGLQGKIDLAFNILNDYACLHVILKHCYDVHFDKSIITFINTDTLQHVLTIFLSGQRPKLFQQNQLRV